MSELLAANRAANQFIQRLYQTTSGRVDAQTLEIADTLGSKRREPHAEELQSAAEQRRQCVRFNLYRAQRIVYDCLASNMEAIAKNEPPTTAPPTAEAIEHRIRTISLDKEGCDAWLANQFGKPDAKAAVKPQKPYPMRVVWAKDGPIDDPTMYIRGGGANSSHGLAHRRVTSPPSRRRPGRTTRSPVPTA